MVAGLRAFPYLSSSQKKAIEQFADGATHTMPLIRGVDSLIYSTLIDLAGTYADDHVNEAYAHLKTYFLRSNHHLGIPYD